MRLELTGVNKIREAEKRYLWTDTRLIPHPDINFKLFQSQPDHVTGLGMFFDIFFKKALDSIHLFNSRRWNDSGNHPFIEQGVKALQLLNVARIPGPKVIGSIRVGGCSYDRDEFVFLRDIVQCKLKGLISDRCLFEPPQRTQNVEPIVFTGR